ncbi:hypothetical protein [Afipia carboxidovorans]|uniref:hypothetical protein n=1 Tax=Afipia carboxidovorans TaxID=40137 RepID=UPI0030D188E8
MTTSEAFLSDIEAFLSRTQMKASAFGWQAVRDPNFVGDLRNGRNPTLSIVERVQEFMREQSAPATTEAS